MERMSDAGPAWESLAAWFAVELPGEENQALSAGVDSGFGFKHDFLTLGGEKVTC